MEEVLTGLVRFNYVVLDQPRVIGGEGEPKYSVTLLMDKKGEESLNKVLMAIEQVKMKAVEEKWGGYLPEQFHYPIQDGDRQRVEHEAYKGHYYLNASSRVQPYMFDEHLQPIKAPSDVYSGCYGRAVVSFYAYDHPSYKGIGCHLIGIQKVAEGERLGGRRMSLEDFKERLSVG